MQVRNFLLLMTVAAAAAMTGWGQTVAAVGPAAMTGWGQTVAAVGPAARASHNAASIPDFSGMWAHQSIPGFEPLAAGPTSLTNRSRREGVSNTLQLVGDYTNPILKPEAAEIVKQHGEMSLSHFGYPTPRNQCWPGGVPFVLSTNGLQIFQQPDKITILYAVDHQVRHVRMNA